MLIPTLPVKLAANAEGAALRHEETNPALIENVVKAVTALFPVASADNKTRIEVSSVRVDTKGFDADALAKWQDARQQTKTISGSILADLVLIRDDKVAQRLNGFRLGQLPLMGALGTFMTNGNDYFTPMQLRLKPGAYTREKTNGEYETFIPTKGANLKVYMDPATGVFKLEVFSSNVSWYALVRSLGTTDDQILDVWGNTQASRELLERNKVKNPDKDLEKFFKTIFEKKQNRDLIRAGIEKRDTSLDSVDKAGQVTAVKTWMSSQRLDPYVTKKTLGEGLDSLSPQVLLQASRRIIEVSKNTHEPDDRDAIEFKTLHHVDDMLPERIKKLGRSLTRRLLMRLSKPGTTLAKGFGSNWLNPATVGFFGGSRGIEGGMANTAEAANPLAILSEHSKITLTGEGGIGSERAITTDARLFRPGSSNFIDLVHTPEGCYSKDTSVYTDKGWVLWPEVTANTRIACNVNGVLEYHLPIKLISYVHTGKMIGYKSARINFLVTPDHRMWARPHYRGSKHRFVTATSLLGKNVGVSCSGQILKRENETTHFTLPTVTAVREGTQKPGQPPIGAHLNLPVKPLEITAWCRFLGWYLSEGNTCKVQKYGSHYTTTITQLHTSTYECSRIESMLNALPFAWRKSGDRRFHISGKQLATYCARFGTCRIKFVPPEVFGAPREARLAFLEAALMGDGRKRTVGKGERGTNPFSKWICYCTTSKQLADDVYRLMFELGLSSTISFEPDHRDPKYLGCYCVQIHSFPGRVLYSKNHRRPDGQFYSIDFSDTVYCAEVPGHLMFVKREAGFGFWCGNSSIGVTTHTSWNTRKRGNVLEALFLKVENGIAKTPVWVSAEEANDSIVAYPEYYDLSTTGKPNEKLVRANKNGAIELVPPSEVQYVIPSGRSMFDHTSNASIFFDATSANRGMMSGKHMTQALPLVNREHPLVTLVDGRGNSVMETLAKTFTVRSKVDGVVTKVTPTEIVVGSTVHEIFNQYAMQAKVALNHIAVVKVGDRVSKGQLIADSNYSKDGKLALGVNVHTAYMPWKGALNYEDAIVISESAAKKFSSEHVHREELELLPGITVDKKLAQAQFPTLFTADSFKKLEENGVIKEGSRIDPGQVLIAAVKKVEFDEHDRSSKNLSSIHKILQRPYRNASVTWTEIFPATVYRVVRTAESITVHLMTQEPMQVGDKLSMSSAAKGTVSAIIADDKMPRTKKGEHIEVILSPHGVVGRVNPSQTLEQAAGKLVKITGKKYEATNFGNINLARDISDKLDKAGISHEEVLFDPETGKDIEKPVGVGYNYMIKLDHAVRKKFSARERDGYTMDETPTRGKGVGGQSYDHLTTYALLGHNAHAILGESAGIRGTKHDEFWHAFQAGELPPPPKVPFVFEKFRAFLNAAGVDTQQRGNTLHYLPMSETRVRAQSNGEIKEGTLIKSKDLAEEKNGLFDPAITGGLTGDKFAHIELNERIPQPLYEKTIRDVLGLKTAEYYGLIAHTKFWNTVTKKFQDEASRDTLTGEAAFKNLMNFNIADKLEEAKRGLRTAVGSDANKLNRAARYLRGLQETKLTPFDAYMTKAVAVLPPKYRPIIEMSGGALRVADSNLMYRDVILTNDALAQAKAANMPADALATARTTLYQSVGALIGVNNALTHRDDRDDAQGLIDTIKGKSNKTGMFQRLIVAHRNDYSGRSTIEPDANLGVDEIGIPEEMAWKLYKPMIVRRLSQLGNKPSDAMEAVEKRTLAARQALDEEMKNRPVLYNRAPSLHRWSVAAAFPRISAGKEIKISPLVVGPLGADFDGNCCIGQTTLTLTFDGISSMDMLQEKYAMRAIGSTKLLSTTPDGLIVSMAIQDVPRTGAGTRDKNGAMVYAVKPGISVLSALPGGGTRFSTVTGVTVEDGCSLMEVVTNGKNSVVVSDNESLVVFDRHTGGILKQKPRAAVDDLVPVVRQFPATEEGTERDYRFGWMFGAFCGDGFFMGGSRRLGFTKLDAPTRNQFEEAMAEFTSASWSGQYAGLKGEDKLGASLKDHYYGDCSVFENCYADVGTFTLEDRACLRKKLPGVMGMDRQFRLGMLAGLLDTDGTVTEVKAASKEKSQLQIMFATSSPYLRDDVIDLCMSLGIRASFTTTKPSSKRLQTHDSYTLSISAVDVKIIAGELRLTCEQKKAVLQKIEVYKFRDSTDPVPVPWKLFDYIRDAKGIFINHQSMLTTLRSLKGKHPFPRVSRETARTVLQVLEKNDLIKENSVFSAWRDIVRDTTVGWERVLSATPKPTERVYDLIIPETKIFAVNGGLIIYDTMSVIPPITEAARLESFKLLPSRNLLFDKDRSLAYGASKDIISGIFALTKPGLLSGKKYESTDAAIAAYHANKDGLLLGSLVTIANRSTPVAIGWLIFEKIVPARFLGSVSAPIDGKKLDKILTDIATQSPTDYNTVSRQLTQAGFQFAAAAGGITTTISELNVDRTKIDRLLNQMEHNIAAAGPEKSDRIAAAKKSYDAINPQLEEEVKSHLKTINRGYHSFIESGSNDKKINQMTQMLASPVMMSDIHDQIVPAVVKSSYAQGMRPSDYVLTTPGSRKGLVARSLSTALPGFLAKELAGNVGDVRIYDKDCNTTRGLEEPLKAPNGIKDYDADLLDRHLLRDIIGTSFKRNDPVTPGLLAQLRDKSVQTIWVRSPMTCQAAKPPCQMCAGRDPTSKLWPIGTNIGYNYGQGISERSTQLTMKVFHAGGTVGAGDALMEGFNRLRELLSVPDVIKKQGTLSTVNGRIEETRLAPQGGYFVYIGDKRVEHHVQQGRDLIVKNGDVVSAGDPISTGNYKPQEIAEHKGTLAAQQYVVNQIRRSYQDAGAVVRKPVIEVLAAAMMRTVEVTDDGGEPDLAIGDVIHENDYENRKKRNQKITAKPTLLGLSHKPLQSKDLLARLNFQRLDDAIRDIPSAGGSSDLTGAGSPISGLAYGAAFRPEADSAFNAGVKY